MLKLGQSISGQNFSELYSKEKKKTASILKEARKWKTMAAEHLLINWELMKVVKRQDEEIERLKASNSIQRANIRDLIKYADKFEDTVLHEIYNSDPDNLDIGLMHVRDVIGNYHCEPEWWKEKKE